jgi:predicted ester cyclase
MADNAEFMRHFYNEVYNRRNVGFLRQHLHPGVLGHGPGIDDVVSGIEDVVAFSEYVYKVYADYHLEVNDVVANDSQVVVRGTVTARHIPTDRPVSFCGMTLYTLENGLVREYWRCYDRHDLYDRQLAGWRPA